MTDSQTVPAAPAPLLWWQSGVTYQIYPRSFKDSNGDGIGDLRGVIEKLDYLTDTLRVDAIWLSPFYRSPMVDFGYDVSDYRDVDPIFGTLADFDELVEKAHARGLQIIVDFVPNHSSDQHPWFQESRKSKDNPKRNWYVWRDAKPDGSEPNNWLSVFGGSAWQWDEQTGQYYLHSFLKEQPDLNWRNPEVKEEMLATIAFWLSRGVDGFRIDVAHFIMKDPDFRDNPASESFAQAGNYKNMGAYDTQVHLYDKGHADNHPLFREVRAVLDEFNHIAPRYSVGEIHISDWSEWATYYGEQNDELHMPFNFALIGTPWNAPRVRDVVENVERVLSKGQTPNYVFSNHDEPRISSRVGADAARSIMMTLLTLRGTPTMYYGDELGMKDTPIPPEREQDPWGKNVPGLGRDPERTPMQWDTSPNAGFAPAGVDTWLPVGSDYETVNVEAQLSDPKSFLSMTRALLKLRKQSPALNGGSYQTVTDVPDDTFVWLRKGGAETLLIAINFTSEPREITPSVLANGGDLLINTTRDRAPGRLDQLTLNAHEGVIVRLTS